MYRASVRRPGGYALILDPVASGGQVEADTITCGHCGGIVHIGLADPEGGGCYQCGEALCKACVDAGVCSPMELYLDAHEGRPLRGRWAESFAEWNRRRLGR